MIKVQIGKRVTGINSEQRGIDHTWLNPADIESVTEVVAATKVVGGTVTDTHNYVEIRMRSGKVWKTSCHTEDEILSAMIADCARISA